MQSRQDEQLLKALYAAERARDASPARSPGWVRAAAEAQAIREVYYRMASAATAEPLEDGAEEPEPLESDD